MAATDTDRRRFPIRAALRDLVELVERLFGLSP